MARWSNALLREANFCFYEELRTFTIHCTYKPPDFLTITKTHGRPLSIIFAPFFVPRWRCEFPCASEGFLIVSGFELMTPVMLLYSSSQNKIQTCTWNQKSSCSLKIMYIATSQLACVASVPVRIPFSSFRPLAPIEARAKSSILFNFQSVSRIESKTLTKNRFFFYWAKTYRVKGKIV